MDETESITVILRGYFSRYAPHEERRVSLAAPVSTALSVQAIIEALTIPRHAVGIVLVNREIASLDQEVRAGDTVEILPLLGGGRSQEE
jgi:sulfur carrier protein ThiS